ncbi:Ion-translocating oxidoreductase complex subunit E [Buchnera aphidicola (Eriosoma lanigerum)]|uniref:electron transport complex subunit E n=1 Tax=Buchnera aphidicola TaxID=9 RepID=UPI0034641DC3
MWIKKIKQICINGLWKRNSTCVQLLGLCPVLAITTNFVNAVGLGISTTIILICTNSMISLIRKFIPHMIRIPIYIIVISSFVSMIDMFIHAFLCDLYSSLGVFIPLIVTNCIVLGQAEMVASRNKIFYSLMDGLFTGIGLTISMIVLGSIREIIGHGTIFYGIFHLFKFMSPNDYIKIIDVDYTMLVACFPAGAFIILALILALKSTIDRMIVS